MQVNLTKAASKLPEWAKEPLPFMFNPDEALRRGAFVTVPKVQTLKKSIRKVSNGKRIVSRLRTAKGKRLIYRSET